MKHFAKEKWMCVFCSVLQRNKQAFEDTEITKVTEVAFEMKVTADTFVHHLQSYVSKMIEIVETQMRVCPPKCWSQISAKISCITTEIMQWQSFSKEVTHIPQASMLKKARAAPRFFSIFLYD